MTKYDFKWPDEVTCYYPPSKLSAMEVATELHEKDWPQQVYVRKDKAPEVVYFRELTTEIQTGRGTDDD